MTEPQKTEPNNLEWQWIPDYENLYGITRDGRVWATKRRTTIARWRKTSTNRFGYSMIGLTKDGVTSTHSIARLVARTYIPNPENKPQVNHIDGNKKNNTVENLEWCTVSENQTHARTIGLHKNQAKGSRHGNAKLTEEDVAAIRKYRAEGYKIYVIAEMFGVKAVTVSKILSGQEWKQPLSNDMLWLDNIFIRYDADKAPIYPDGESAWKNKANNDKVNSAREYAKLAITAKINEMQTEAYKKGYIQCGLDELRKYENDKG